MCKSKEMEINMMGSDGRKKNHKNFWPALKLTLARGAL